VIPVALGRSLTAFGMRDLGEKHFIPSGARDLLSRPRDRLLPARSTPLRRAARRGEAVTANRALILSEAKDLLKAT
jgi:hypothetical protein